MQTRRVIQQVENLYALAVDAHIVARPAFRLLRVPKLEVRQQFPDAFAPRTRLGAAQAIEFLGDIPEIDRSEFAVTRGCRLFGEPASVAAHAVF